MRCEAPDDLLRHLWSRGFDATRGAWSLYPVPAPAERPDATAPEAHEVMGRIVYLPVYPGVRTREFERLAGALAEFKRLSPAAVAAEGATA